MAEKVGRDITLDDIYDSEPEQADEYADWDMARVYRALGVPDRYFPFIRAQEHIQLEKWGMAGDVAAIDAWIGDDAVKKEFLLFHISQTEPNGFVWKYPHQATPQHVEPPPPRRRNQPRQKK